MAQKAYKQKFIIIFVAYYILRASTRNISIKDPAIPKDISFQTGERIIQKIASLLFQVNANAKNIPDFMYSVIPIFSDTLLKKLENLGVKNLQIFEAQLENPKTREKWNTYNAVNILGIVSCLAVEESNAVEELPPLYSFDINDLVIYEKKTKGSLMFRLKEAPDMILINKKIGDTLIDSGFSGLEFLNVKSI